MRKPILILYAAGAYGTFIEWLLTYLTDQTLDDQLPFGKFGNAHNFVGNQIYDDGYAYCRTKDSHGNEIFKKIDETYLSHNKFFRIHHPPNIEGEKFLFPTTISIITPPTSTLWILRNMIEKNGLVEYSDDPLTPDHPDTETQLSILNNVERIRSYGDQLDKLWIDSITNHLEHQHYKVYNVNRVEDLERWQIREIFSYWNIHATVMNTPTLEHTNNYCINVEDIRDQMPTVINDLIEKLELKVISYRHEKLDWIWQEWKAKQKYANMDAIVDEYIKNVINGIDQTMPFSFNICEEIVIQQKLREAGYEIKCNGLDSLPLRTIDLKELLHNA